MKIWHISDTHTFHDLLEIPDNIDMVIHSGDCSNPRDVNANENEVRNFIEWYSQLPIKHKIFVAGNHDVSIERNRVKKVDFETKGIIYLENDWVEIEMDEQYSHLPKSKELDNILNVLKLSNNLPLKKIKIWGSPITPSFGQGWAFNKDRSKTANVWKHIPDDTDIVVVHGPPKGILDLSYDREGKLEFCGDIALKKRMLALKPKLCLFGHIHNSEDIINAGKMQLSIEETIFSNGSVVTDGKFGKLSSNGNTFKI